MNNSQDDAKLFAVSCPTCGANLQIDNSIGIVQCQYCGQNISVNPKIKNVNIDKISNLFKLIENLGNNDNFTCYNYYCQILELDPLNIKAWMGKGETAISHATLLNPMIAEALNAFGNVEKYLPEGNKNEYDEIIAFRIIELAVNFYRLSCQEYAEYFRSWGYDKSIYTQRIDIVLSLFDTVIMKYKSFTRHKDTIKMAFDMCNDVADYGGIPRQYKHELIKKALDYKKQLNNY